MGKRSNLSDKEFLAYLRNNAGLYARTARAIERDLGIKFTRQAIQMRASKFPNEIKDIKEQNIDIAEEALHDLMRSKNPSIKLKAAELYLRTIGKGRGYVEKAEVDVSNIKKTVVVKRVSRERRARNRNQ